MRRRTLLLNTKRNLRSDITVNGPKISCIGQEILRIPDRKLHPIGLQLGIEIGCVLGEGWVVSRISSRNMHLDNPIAMVKIPLVKVFTNMINSLCHSDETLLRWRRAIGGQNAEKRIEAVI